MVRLTIMVVRRVIIAALTSAGLASASAAADSPNRMINPDAPMSFEYTGNGGNIKGSDWIAAEGTITADTPNKFKEVLSKASRNTTVRFNSPGGNLVAAIKLGEMIREAHLDTSIGRTVFNENGGMWSAELPGICVSACAYAFLGGDMRIVGKNDRYGVHQFYDSKALDEPTKKAFSALDLSIDQILSGIVLDYVLRMGVDARLVSLAEGTVPSEMHYLSAVELASIRVDNTGSTDTGWTIQARDGGAVLSVVSTYSTRPAVAVALECHQNKTPPTLIITSSTKYLDRWLSEGYGAQQPLTSQQIAKSLAGINLRGVGWARSLDGSAVAYLDVDTKRRITAVVNLDPAVLKLIRGGGPLRIEFNFPFSFAGFLSAEIASTFSPETFDLVLRNCVR